MLALAPVLSAFEAGTAKDAWRRGGAAAYLQKRAGSRILDESTW
ncbi:MAG TPA: hypothetical protein VIW24_30320 [Aldersonia sp.]